MLKEIPKILEMLKEIPKILGMLNVERSARLLMGEFDRGGSLRTSCLRNILRTP